MLLLFVLLGTLTSTTALSFMSGAEDEQTVGVDISLMHSTHTREKRSAAQLPDILHFRFDLGGSTIELKLSQSSRHIDSIPVFTKQEGGASKHHQIPKDENVALFQDASRGSVVLVSRDGDEYKVAGNFHHGERLYQIWPQSHVIQKRRAGVVRNGHSVRRVKQYNLSNDARLLISHDMVRTSYTSGDNAHHRQKRQTTSYTIEVGAFPDFSDYSYFLTEAGNNADTALSNMRTYYAFIEQSMQMRFDTVNAQDESITIRVLFKYIKTATSAGLSPWTEGLKRGTLVADEPALNDFTSFIQDSNNAVTSADHYIAFTRLDLEYDGNTAVAGLAFLGSLCTSSATSIVENTFDGFTAALAAHELGHSLNARHDTDEGCSDDDNFIMSPKLTMPTENNPSRLWTFSSCSVSVFKSFLNTPSGQCSLATTVSNGLSDGSQIAGQETNADKQCARIVGSGSKFCRTAYTGNRFHAVCQTLKCSGTDGDVNTCDDYVAYEGTSCGDGKWCEKGMCVSSDSAPSRPDDCPQGDDPDFACQQSSCTSYSPSQRLLCCSSCSSSSSNNNNNNSNSNSSNDNEILQVGHSSTVMTTPAVLTTTPFVPITTVERFIVTLCYYRPPFFG